MANNIRIRASVEDKASGPIDNIRGKFDRLRAQGAKGLAIGAGVAVAGAGIALAGRAVGAAVEQFANAAQALLRIERIGFQTEARLRSTGGAANITADGVAALAGKLEKLTGIEAESIQEGQNLLLTFTRIRNEVGAGNNIFDRTTGLMADLSVAMGTDVSSAAMQLGKALNDPVAGLGALSRAGVQLTKQQKEQVRALVETGDMMGAQKIILRELETQIGGSAEAFGNTTSGKIAKFGHEWGAMVESIVLGAVDVGSAVGSTGDMVAMHFGDMGDRSNALADKMGIGFGELASMVNDRMLEAGGSVTDALEHIEGEFDDAKLGTREKSWEMMQGILSSVHSGGEEVEREFERIASEPVNIMNRQLQPIRDAAFQSQVSYAKGLIDGQNQPLVQMEALVQLQAEALDRGTETARLMGQLHSTELAAGMASTIGEVRAQAEATRLAIVNRLATLGVDASSWGYGIGASLASGLDGGYGVVINAAGRLARAVRGQIGINSEPSDPSSALRGITKWGGNIATTMAEGMIGQLGTVKGAAASVAAGLVPSVSSPQLAFAGGGAASGGPVVVQLQLDGRTVAEVVDRHLYYMAPRGGVLPRN